MPAPQPRVLEFDVSVDEDRTARSGAAGSPLPQEDAWSAEHLALAALVRCTLSSLDYSAQRSGLTAVASGSAHGVMTKRESDGLYAFVDVEARYDVELDGVPDAPVVTELLERAERGCFVGNSLIARPRYRWRVNGVDVQ